MTIIYPLQRSFPPRRRRANWVGRCRIKLAERLDKALAEMGYESEIEPAKILPAQGAWRTDHRLDVYRIEGSLRLKINGHWMTRNLASWDTMTDLLRCGFIVDISDPMYVELHCKAADGR